MDLILLAVPFFFVLIAVELIADSVRGQRNYRLADSINSLSTGVLSTSTGLMTKGVGLVTYALAWEHLALLRLPGQAWWVWLLAFVLYDFCYYWLHRLGHERNVLWAAHSVHHQSEEYNPCARPAAAFSSRGSSTCPWRCSAYRRWYSSPWRR